MLKKQYEFSADASHELRTPLTSIIMELEAIKRTQKKIPTDLSSSLENIKEDALRMKRLVNDLLALILNQSDQNNSHELFILNEVAQNSFNLLKKVAQEKKLDYIFEENEKIKIKGDIERIKQALTIILKNAIKYTSSGSVTIKIEPTNQKMALVEITDTGIGIPRGDIPHIFERFYRAHNRTKTQGTGLGLAIAKKIIDDHKGKITVKSIIDKGSTFSIYLPLVS